MFEEENVLDIDVSEFNAINAQNTFLSSSHS